MNARILVLIICSSLAVPAWATVYTIGPLAVTTGGGTITNVGFTDSFRGRLNSFLDYFHVGDVVNKINSVLNYGSGNENINLIPGKNNQIPTPPGWSSPDSPPSSTNTIPFYSMYGTKFDSVSAACNYYLTYGGLSGFNFTSSSISGNMFYCSYTDSNGNPRPNMSGGPISQGCNSGYTLQSGSCNLTNPALVKWPSDGQCTIVQGADGQMKPHPRDPDVCGGGGTFAGGGASGTWNNVGQDNNKNPVAVQYHTKPEGIDINRHIETIDDQGVPIVDSEIVHINDAGAITNVYHVIYYYTNINDVINGTAPPPGTTPVNVVKFPNVTVSGSGGTLSPFGDSTRTTADSLALLNNAFRNHSALGPLFQFNENSTSTACPLGLSLTLSPFGRSWHLSTDIMCDLMAVIAPILSAITLLAFSYLAVTILLSA